MTHTIDFDLDTVPIRGQNAHDHWRNRQQHSKHVRTRVAWLAKAKMPAVPFDNGPVHVRFTLLAPDRRRRDPDGLATACKPVLDGLVDAGWMPDDSWHHVDAVTYSCFPAKDVAQEPGWVVHISQAVFCDDCGRTRVGDCLCTYYAEDDF